MDACSQPYVMHDPNRIHPLTLSFSAVCLVLLLGCRPQEQGPGGPPVIRVVAIEAEQRPVAETLALVGTLAANEIVEIQSETDGVIEAILFDEGQPVERGHLLVQLDDSKLAAGLAEAEANFRLSQVTYQRTRQLYQDQLISQQEFDQAAAMFDFNRAALELRQRQLDDTRILAPFSGTVGARNISPGQVISKNTTLTWLVDLDPIKVEFHVPERFLGRTRLGQTVDFPVPAFPDSAFTGQIYYISPYVEATTRTAIVKATIPNPNHDLLPGMLATLELTLRVSDNAVVIPEAALAQILDDNHASVYVVSSAHNPLTVEPRKVQLGVRLPGAVEILNGLLAGELVVVEGIQKIGPGTHIELSDNPDALTPYRLAPPRSSSTDQ
jgi:membrane fusion protein, multidrug efflux system